jgi:hypothetical protein
LSLMNPCEWFTTPWVRTNSSTNSSTWRHPFKFKHSASSAFYALGDEGVCVQRRAFQSGVPGGGAVPSALMPVQVNIRPSAPSSLSRSPLPDAGLVHSHAPEAGAVFRLVPQCCPSHPLCHPPNNASARLGGLRDHGRGGEVGNHLENVEELRVLRQKECPPAPAQCGQRRFSEASGATNSFSLKLRGPRVPTIRKGRI